MDIIPLKMPEGYRETPTYETHTLSSFDKVLKELWVGPIREQLNRRSEFMVDIPASQRSLNPSHDYRYPVRGRKLR